MARVGFAADELLQAAADARDQGAAGAVRRGAGLRRGRPGRHVVRTAAPGRGRLAIAVAGPRARLLAIAVAGARARLLAGAFRRTPAPATTAAAALRAALGLAGLFAAFAGGAAVAAFLAPARCLGLAVRFAGVATAAAATATAATLARRTGFAVLCVGGAVGLLSGPGDRLVLVVLGLRRSGR